MSVTPSEDHRRPDIKVWLVCTGVGLVDRGIETFARECFDGLHGRPGLRLQLFKGRGPEHPPDERRLPCFPRDTFPARLLGAAIRRNGYVAEQITSLLAIWPRLRTERPDVVFLSEGNLRRYLFLLRQRIGVPFRILFSNGGPVSPPFPDMDHVQQPTPHLLDVALAAGESAGRHSLVPYGIRVPAGPPPGGDDPAAVRRAVRERLGLPAGERKIVISVGSLSTRDHKRMDYIIREVASLPAARRPFLVLLGYQDEASAPNLALAGELLGAAGFTARSVPYARVADYYLAADVFALASTMEGFGRVYLEALMAGLPVLAHDHPAMRYVLGSEGAFADLTRPGGMAAALVPLLDAPPDPAAAARRRESVRARFGWDALFPAYLEMFHRCRETPLPFPVGRGPVGRAGR